jgi:hypothetical protein
MNKPPRQFVLKRVYEMASLVEGCIDDEESLIELDWADPELLRGLAKFSKISLLHRYIYAMIAVEHRREYRKNADLYETEEISILERLFDAYDVIYLPYRNFRSQIPPEEVTPTLKIPSTSGSNHRKRPLSYYGRSSRTRHFICFLGTGSSY